MGNTFQVATTAVGILLLIVLYSSYFHDRLEKRLESLLITLIATTVGVLLAFEADRFLQEEQQESRYQATLEAAHQTLNRRIKRIEYSKQVFERSATGSDSVSFPAELLFSNADLVPPSFRRLATDPSLLDQAAPGFRSFFVDLYDTRPDPQVRPEARNRESVYRTRFRQMWSWSRAAASATGVELLRISGELSLIEAVDSLNQVSDRWADSTTAVYQDQFPSQDTATE